MNPAATVIINRILAFLPYSLGLLSKIQRASKEAVLAPGVLERAATAAIYEGLIMSFTEQDRELINLGGLRSSIELIVQGAMRIDELTQGVTLAPQPPVAAPQK